MVGKHAPIQWNLSVFGVSARREPTRWYDFVAVRTIETICRYGKTLYYAVSSYVFIHIQYIYIWWSFDIQVFKQRNCGLFSLEPGTRHSLSGRCAKNYSRFLKHILLLPIVRKVKIGMVSQLILGVPIQNQADIELEWHVVFLCRERSWSQIPDMFFFGVRSGAGIGVLLACAMQT